MRVHQWVPAAHKGDAIGDSARRTRDLLREMGHESEIFALTIDDELRHEIQPFSDPESRRGDITMFHYALPSPMSAAFAALSHGRVLQYHNVTPARFFAPYAPSLFRLASIAREELAGLARSSDLALGDSESQPPGAGGSRVLQHGDLPDRGQHGAPHPGTAASRARGHSRRRPRELPVCGADRAEQEN